VGNLTLAQHVSLWWERVVANVDHLGPFRPVVWAHWQIAANVLGADPFAWRLSRLIWCGLAAGLLLAFLREMGVRPTAALFAGAAAMWNPYRNDIWTSLTLAEGVAMPYALLALIAARRARDSSKSLRWDAMAIGGLFAALGCKNTFVGILPAMLYLRTISTDEPWRTAIRKRAWVILSYSIPLLLPVGHFIYFKLHPQPCHYQTPGPSWQQVGRYLSWFKGGAGLDAIGLGLGVIALSFAIHRVRVGAIAMEPGARSAIVAAGLLLLGGSLVYLPVAIMTGRYTMPAVWGWDLLVGLALTHLEALKSLSWKRASWACMALGVLVLAVANVGRQEKLMARSQLLWDNLIAVEQTIPAGATMAWISGSSELGELHVEEGIHFAWHLENRRVNSVKIQLRDIEDHCIERVELPPSTAVAEWRILASSARPTLEWTEIAQFHRTYRQGRRQFQSRIERRVPSSESGPSVLDPISRLYLKTAFEQGSTSEALRRLLPRSNQEPSLVEKIERPKSSNQP
jgi:hypothetical protein